MGDVIGLSGSKATPTFAIRRAIVEKAQMDSIIEIFRDLLIFVAAMFALFIALIVIVSMLPEDNPLKRILSALSYRVGATLAVGTIALPIEWITGIDVVYDVAAPIGLAWFWYIFFRDVYRGVLSPRKPAAASGPIIDQKPSRK